MKTSPAEPLQPTSSISRLWLAFFGLCVAVAAVLRFVWLEDMEYKDDEQWMFEHAMRIPDREPWPDLGMPSGVGLRNPGLSVSIFAVMAKLAAVENPLELCQSVAGTNVLAFALLFVGIVWLMPVGRRESWGWALALSAVSPLGVLLQRKIWAQSVLPVLCVLFLFGWMRRQRWWGAALWGFIGAVLGQIHMSGFFFAGAFFLCEVTLGSLRIARPATKWLGWFGGSLAGAWPLIPWVEYVLKSNERSHSNWWDTVSSLRFFKAWFSDSLGLGLDYSLGDQYLDFLRYPLVGSKDYYPALYLHGVAFSLGVFVLFCAMQAAYRTPLSLKRAIIGIRSISEDTFTLFVGFLAYGVLLTLSGVPVHRHYLVIVFPLEGLLLAMLALKHVARPRLVLGVLWGTQLALSLTFLHYIHENGGAIRGDYGRAYSAGAQYRWGHPRQAPINHSPLRPQPYR